MYDVDLKLMIINSKSQSNGESLKVEINSEFFFASENIHFELAVQI
jgi:hypothetical protein